MFAGFEIGINGRVSTALVRPLPGPAPSPAPSWSVQPSIAGTAAEGQTLTGSDGTIAGGTVSARAWLRSGNAISGATGTSYVLSGADVGATISYRVTANGAGGTAQATSAATAIVAAAPTLVPADWRIPASVTTSTGLAGSQTALAAAQSAASAKSRPSFTVATGATEYVEWTVQSAGTAILSWIGQSAGTASVAKNGVDQGFAVVAPSGSDIDGVSGTGGRRQFVRMPVTAGDTIRLTIAAGAAARTVFPLLHKLPASGPWDAHVVFGASREAYAFGSKLMEDAIIADDATRDPIVFNYAVAGQVVSIVATNAATAAPIYAGTARYALLGSIIGNNVSANRPYTSGQKAALDATIASIASSLSGYTLGFANTSYRAYTGAPAVSPTAQENGSLPYNDAVIGPAIAAYAPDCYDSSLQRSRIDDYLAILFNRGALTDEVHGAETAERALWVATWFRYVRTGSWGTSQIEQRVAGAEAAASTKATALSTYNEAVYAMAAIASAAPGKAALQTRLDTIYPTVLFYEAVRLIDAAVAATSQPTKDAAQAGLNAASAAGYSGGTAPNTIAAQQARIDAIVISTVTKRVKIGFGTNTATSGWNKTNASTLGVAIANLNDDTGAASGWALEITNAGTGIGASGAQGAAVGAEFPDAILLNHFLDTGGTCAVRINGLNPAKSYKVRVIGSRAGTGTRLVNYAANGGTVQTVDVLNNVGTPASFAAISPNGSSQIEITAARGTGNTLGTYFNGLIIEELA